ncbi:MAG: globin domain-containing protein [Gemmatimonadales bacterium]
MIDDSVVATAKASYDRCCAVPAFFQAFYTTFFEACPEAKPLFARTNFERQNRLLRHAIGLLLIFPRQPEGEPTLLTRIAERHREIGIEPRLYAPFVDSLMATVRRYDPECTPAVERAWRDTVGMGVAYLCGH